MSRGADAVLFLHLKAYIEGHAVATSLIAINILTIGLRIVPSSISILHLWIDEFARVTQMKGCLNWWDDLLAREFNRYDLMFGLDQTIDHDRRTLG